jgi:hypothetical protein
MLACALTHGASKYGRDNFKQGHQWSRCLDAALRHIYHFASGEDCDQESKINHIGHALASLAMLAYHSVHHPHLDDRKGPKPP